jgi:hypothetical protein
MHRSSSVLLAATFAGLIAPSVGLVRLDAPSGHVVAPSISSPKQRSGVPSLTRSEGLLLNKQPLQVQHPCKQAQGRLPLRADYPQSTAIFCFVCGVLSCLFTIAGLLFVPSVTPTHFFHLPASCVQDFVCAYVFVFVCVYFIYVCAYTHRERGRDRQTGRENVDTLSIKHSYLDANICQKVLEYSGFSRVRLRRLRRLAQLGRRYDLRAAADGSRTSRTPSSLSKAGRWPSSSPCP